MKKALLIRQRDLTDCGAACIASICAYYGLYAPVSLIRQYASTDQQGSTVLGLIEAAEKLGLLTKGAKISFDLLPVIQLPAVAHVIIREKTGHFVVIAGFTKNHVIIMDPAEGRFKKLEHEVFKRIWTGVIVLLIPGEQFQPARQKKLPARLIELARPDRHMLMAALLGAILVSLIGLSTSVYLQLIVDVILANSNTGLLNWLSFLMCGLLVIQVVVGIVKDFLVLRSSQRIDAKLVLGYYRHLLRLPQQFFDSMRVGEMMSRINDAVRISAFINEVSISIVVNALILVFSVTLMLIYHWKLGILMLIAIPVYAIIFFINDRVNKIWQRRMMESGADLDAQLAESLTGAGTVKRLMLEEQAYNKTDSSLQKLLKTAYRFSARQIYIQSSADFVTRLLTIILLWTGSYFVISKQLSEGELLSFYALISYFTAPLLYLLGAGKNIRDAQIAADRLFEIMDIETEKSGSITSGGNGVMDIVFNDVSFKYGTGDPVLKNIQLTIPHGTITGIAGESGSGKSTLAGLLQKLYPPTEGIITISGINIMDMNNCYLRSLVVMVPQHTDPFTGTIYENIATNSLTPDIEKIKDLSKRLGISEFADKLPLGLDTVLTGQGSILSGGQRQRISIARALYRNPPVLVLDEATASLDIPSEKKIMQTLEWYNNRGNTVIIIAHRPSTLKICKNVIIINNGQVK